ncbi:site-specific integrase [Nostoc punctiforme FACHB-252]|uniref:Site-specific integrase n=1 Tax=Nostoc punctiforme FACHB-252 TaxID=1357509 RepID=A0ABR8H4X1_NOSPU|nr:tyrosine-type recombinase/integrase [Nostoc punctiforme]MBD2610433.1 site-specific integrase [Nostoc punctiforme FACHB-252]
MREIKPVNNNGSIQLKFSLGGKRYGFNPLPGGHYEDKRDLAIAQAIATKIQNDILSGHFDPTLDRYRLVPKATLNTQPKTLLELWDIWVKTLELPTATEANHYKWVRRMITKASPGITDTDWITKVDIAPRTFKDRLGLIKACCKWGVSKGYLETNPYESIKLPKDKPKEIKPFTQEEIKLILEGFDKLAPHYSPFVRFLMATGVRTSEAIGLLWEHVDFHRSEIIIKESLSKDLTGNGYRRVRKETKTGNIRYLPMSLELQALLIFLRPPKVNPDSLVFTSPQGCIIDADNFRCRQWTKVLKAQGIPYRKPYTTRHTMISHAIDQGIPITGVAYLAGHKDTSMIIKNYGHMINRPSLPSLPI